MADEQKKSSFFSDMCAPVAGFGVTFSTMFRKVATAEYPEERRPTQPRFHGRHQLIYSRVQSSSRHIRTETKAQCCLRYRTVDAHRS